MAIHLAQRLHHAGAERDVGRLDHAGDEMARLAEAAGRQADLLLVVQADAFAHVALDLLRDRLGVKPLFSGRSLGEGETATFDVVLSMFGVMFAARPERVAARSLARRATSDAE